MSEYDWRTISSDPKSFTQDQKFETGATRDGDTDKIDFEGFLSPLALEAFGDYMHRARHTKQGMRDSDNWQRGIPLSWYMKSMFRHFVSAWKKHRGGNQVDMVDDLCALWFNTQGYLHEILQEKSDGDSKL